MKSLRIRLIAGGVLAILAALTVAGIALSVMFERHVARTISDDLDVYLKQLVAGVDIDENGRLVVNNPPADPRFADPLSGLYWQIGDDRGQVLRSRSLWDTTLPLVLDAPAPGEVHHHRTTGPAGSGVLLAERVVRLTIGGTPVPIRLAVATDLARLSAAQSRFVDDLLEALAVLAAVLALATSVQVVLGLRPLVQLRRGVAEIRSGKATRLPVTAPSEVIPLVEEVNELLAAQEREVERSRSHAADLAHGLKTPLAALAADAERLQREGQSAAAAGIELATEQMRRHVQRELARARVRAGTPRGQDAATPVRPLVEGLVATLSRIPGSGHIRFDVAVAADSHVPLDRADLAEVLGNLLENAARHAKSRVRIAEGTGRARLCVEDDGPGIDPRARTAALARGVRLDQRGSAGLGLAIVQDVLDAYGWALELGTSDLGGLRASLGSGAESVRACPGEADTGSPWKMRSDQRI